MAASYSSYLGLQSDSESLMGSGVRDLAREESDIIPASVNSEMILRPWFKIFRMTSGITLVVAALIYSMSRPASSLFDLFSSDPPSSLSVSASTAHGESLLIFDSTNLVDLDFKCDPEHGPFDFLDVTLEVKPVDVAVERALALLNIERRARCEALPFDAQDFMIAGSEADNDIYREQSSPVSSHVEVMHKYGKSCQSETYRLHFYVPGGQFVLEINKNRKNQMWQLIKSTPEDACSINSASAALPVYLHTKSDRVSRAAKFVETELTNQLKELKCEGFDPESLSVRVEKVLRVRSTVLVGALLDLKMEMKGLIPHHPEATSTVSLDVLSRCNKVRDGCINQLELPHGVKDVCELVNQQKERRLLEADEDSFMYRLETQGFIDPDATETLEAKRSMVYPRVLTEGTLRDPLVERHIQEQTSLPESHDPTSLPCYQKVAVYDQGSCGSCYAASVAQMMGIRKCLQDVKEQTKRPTLYANLRPPKPSTAAGAIVSQSDSGLCQQIGDSGRLEVGHCQSFSSDKGSQQSFQVPSAGQVGPIKVVIQGKEKCLESKESKSVQQVIDQGIQSRLQHFPGMFQSWFSQHLRQDGSAPDAERKSHIVASDCKEGAPLQGFEMPPVDGGWVKLAGTDKCLNQKSDSIEVVPCTDWIVKWRLPQMPPRVEQEREKDGRKNVRGGAGGHKEEKKLDEAAGHLDTFSKNASNDDEARHEATHGAVAESERLLTQTACEDDHDWSYFDEQRIDCDWFAEYDPGCRIYHDRGQRTLCRRTCGTCPPAYDGNPWKGSWYNYMPSLTELAGCASTGGVPRGCGGGNVESIWNSWMQKLQRPLNVMGEDCMPYRYKCLRAQGVVNKLGSGLCENYEGWQMWHKPCSCIPSELQPSATSCPTETLSRSCSFPIPPAMFEVKSVKHGLTPQQADENIRRHILEYGPVYMSFAVPGCFLTWDWNRFPVFDGTGSVIGGHAVLAVGWGTHRDKNYWYIRNSWGSKWGDKGHFKYLRGQNLGRIESWQVAASMPTSQFADWWSPPVCDIVSTQVMGSKNAAGVVTSYEFRPTVRCSKTASVKIWVSQCFDKPEQAQVQHFGTFMDALVEKQTPKQLFADISKARLCYGAKQCVMWIRIAATSGTSTGLSPRYVSLGPVPGATRAADGC